MCGGEPGPAATLAPKLGPLGLNAKKIGEEIVKKGTEYKGIRCMIQLKCQNRAAEINVVPTSSALIIKELGDIGRDRKKTKNITHKGNLAYKAVEKIAKIIHPKSMSKSYTGTVLQVLGTCLSVGCTVNGKSPKDIIQEIKRGELKVSKL